MKIKLNQLEHSIKVISTIANKELSIVTSFKLTKLMKQMQNEYDDFNKSRSELVTKYAIKDEEAKPIIKENGTVDIIPDKLEEFNKEFFELLNLEVQFHVDPFKIEDFGNITISAVDLLNLDFLFEQ